MEWHVTLLTNEFALGIFPLSLSICLAIPPLWLPCLIKFRADYIFSSSRYDGVNHWIGNTELDETGQTKRRNCKACLEAKKKDAKCRFICKKCNVPLHVNCFEGSDVNYCVVSLSLSLSLSLSPSLSLSLSRSRSLHYHCYCHLVSVPCNPYFIMSRMSITNSTTQQFCESIILHSRNSGIL